MDGCMHVAEQYSAMYASKSSARLEVSQVSGGHSGTPWYHNVAEL